MMYLNENDKWAAAWLRQLIADGLLPPGDVDERSITDVQPGDLKGYAQHHFFAGIGGWPLALQIANWPADRSVWTGSCPCQPLSVAGAKGGAEDERHLWPEFARLICELQPATVFGEQVASKLGREWLAGVRLDLEEMGYAVGSADLCAAGVGAPHKRQRLFWVGNSTGAGLGRHARHGDDSDQSGRQQAQPDRPASATGATYWQQFVAIQCEDGKSRRVPARWVADTAHGDGRGRVGPAQKAIGPDGVGRIRSAGGGQAGGMGGPESGAQLEIEPLLFPLANGVPNRVGLLRGSGNAIVPQVAAEFIKAFLKI